MKDARLIRIDCAAVEERRDFVELLSWTKSTFRTKSGLMMMMMMITMTMMFMIMMVMSKKEGRDFVEMLSWTKSTFWTKSGLTIILFLIIIFLIMMMMISLPGGEQSSCSAHQTSGKMDPAQILCFTYIL